MLKFLNRDEIGEPPWDYDFLYNLPQSEYPKYLAKIFNYRTGEKLPLKWDFRNRVWIINKNKCKTFNQKLQWIKLYGITPLMRYCTDKVKVRDYVKEKIGEEYLKPVFQIIPNKSQETMRCHCEQVNYNLGLARQSGNISSDDTLDCHADIKMSSSARLCFPKFQFRENRVFAEFNDRALVFKDNDNKNYDVSAYFDQIDFDKLPNAFVLKCNHGSKWHYIIKDKEKYLNTTPLFEITKSNINNWLEMEYCFLNGFEMQYMTSRRTESPNRIIQPKIIIEALLRDEINISAREIEVYCFNGQPKIFLNVKYDTRREITCYNEDFSIIDLVLHPDGKNIIKNEKADDLLNQTFVLSKQLSKDFNFVRCDWLVYKNKLYFNELTFTPYSGFIEFDKKWNEKLGNWIY